MRAREGQRSSPGQTRGRARVLVTCEDCGETWEAPASLVGQTCNGGRIRLATGVERARWEASWLF